MERKRNSLTVSVNNVAPECQSVNVFCLDNLIDIVSKLIGAEELSNFQF